MIFGGVLAGAFLYFMIAFLRVSWPVYLFFGAAAVIVHVLYKKKHFKTSQLSLVFMYLITVLLWFKGSNFSPDFFIYALGGSALALSLSDLFLKRVLKIAGWVLIAVAVGFLAYERLGSVPLSILVGAIVIPIALQDRERVERNTY